jgi:DNA-directed RNA polymerase II subunit RPB2
MNYSWSVLDSYFNSNRYFLTKHHLDSFNDFITSKITNTIKILNPIVMLKIQDNGKLTHEVNIFIGGTDGNDVFINKPTLFNENTRILYPNEARLKDLTYKSDIYANIVVKYITREKGKADKIEEEQHKQIKIGSIPIMLNSRLCVLNNQTPDVLREMGECPYDQGGYFLIDGKEKVIVAQERIATNRIFINRSKDPKFNIEGLIRCTSDENPLFPKTIRMFVLADKLEKSNKKEDNDNAETTFPKTRNAILIDLPNIDINVPLCVLFRALGIESDKEIIQHITDVDKESNKDIVDFLRFSIIQCSAANIFTQEDAFNYLINFVEYKNVDKLRHVLLYDLFPNVGYSFKNKALFLGHIINKLVKVALGAAKESDRDSYIFKRVDISGFLVGNLFRDYYNQFRNAIRNKLDNEYLYGHWRKSKVINTLVNKSNIPKIFRADIIEDGMKKSLKGMWGRSMIEETQDLDLIKQGIVQDLSRISYLGTISHLRRVNTPMDPTAKIVEPHRLHTSQWGIMCPCESPDGASIGLLKNMAIMCHITFDYNKGNAIKFLQDYQDKNGDIIFIEDINTTTKEHIHSIKILVNSNWVAICNNPVTLVKLFKLCKRNGYINTFTSISWNVLKNEINILTEAGRCCRPLYVVEGKKLLINKWKSKIESGAFKWNQLISGSDSVDFDPLHDRYVNVFDKYKGKDVDKIIELLEETQAPIEYIDVEEANSSLVAVYDSDILSSDNKYTHCEIHPSTLFSVVTHNIPLANHNQAPRNIFSGAQGKQAIGWYATNFNNRIDTMSYVLHYPQKCLVNTRYMEYMNMNKLPNGENLIVAMATYTGYNQEDAILMNKDSVQRGMFNLTYFKNIIDFEDENKKDNEKFVFLNPLELANKGKLTKMKFGNYKKLDKNGFPLINSYIKEGDVIIGKCKVSTTLIDDPSVNSIFGNKVKSEVYEDKSMIADKTVSGIIDKVYLYDDVNGNKNCKIRMRKIRTPELGDKCCCYDEETEILTTNGWKYFKDLTMEDKVATNVNNSLVYQNPTDIQKYDFDGLMYEVDSNQVNLSVTDNHRMFVRTRHHGYNIKEAKDLFGKVSFYKKNINEWKPDINGAPDELLLDNGKVVGFYIPGFMDNKGTEYDDLILDIEPWLTLFGIWIAEGCTLRDDYVSIAANKQRVKDALEKVCLELDFQINKHKTSKNNDERNSWIIVNRVLVKYILPLSVGGNNKYLPEWVWYLDREQCRTLIHGMLLGDGDFGTLKNGRYYTTSTILADQFQRLCLHAGFSANKALKYEKGHTTTKKDGSTITTNADYWVLGVIDKQNEPIVNKYMNEGKQNDRWVKYKGNVWCCTVPEGNGIIYVRRKGVVVWSGNSKHKKHVLKSTRIFG